MLDHHHGSHRNVDAADFNYCRSHKNFNLARLKFAHHAFLFVGIQTPMQQTDMQVRKDPLAQLPVPLMGRLQNATQSLMCW